jgi:hypothetical protein
METSIKSAALNTISVKSKTAKTSSSVWEALEFNRFAIVAMLILLVGCLGGLAAAFGAGGSVIKLSVVAFPTVITLALILAVSPMRMVMYASAIAVILDLLVLIF